MPRRPESIGVLADLGIVVAIISEDHDQAVRVLAAVLEERILVRRGFRMIRANVFNDPFLDHPELVELRNAVPPPELE